jgi:hypothetical protein
MCLVNEQASLIAEIEAYCRQAGVAESTFGRQVVNDGKFVGRLRDGKGVTTATVAKVREYLSEKNKTAADSQKNDTAVQVGPAGGEDRAKDDSQENKKKSAFRFYDNRQKYLMFVNTCSEKWVVAERAGMELAHIHPKPPALRVFDAGMGDGTVITGVMR